MTRVEVLSVGLVIGIIGVVAGFSVMAARERVRDITRLAHVREVQVGLELYANDHGAYPTVAPASPLGEAQTACLADAGFTAPCAGSSGTTYVAFVPAPPTQGLKGAASCGDVQNAYCYQGNGQTFGITFELEKPNQLLGLVKGANCATPEGLRPGVCPTLP